ncbi:MAG: hypothetical protein K1X81_09475 [Bacteroidia bacterium]|nr:hypothetical protein [Bacteroidia bacterium]
MKFKNLLVSVVFILLVRHVAWGQQFHSPEKAALQRQVKTLETTWNEKGVSLFNALIFADSGMSCVWGNTICYSEPVSGNFLKRHYPRKPELKLVIESIGIIDNTATVVVYWDEYRNGKMKNRKVMSLLYEKKMNRWSLIRLHCS